MAALPALIRTWSARGNRPNAANSSALLIAQSTIFALKEHMKDTAAGGSVGGTRNPASVWVTKGSSDGTTFDTSGTDLITSHTNLVWAAGNHSWWWGENVASGYQCVIACYGGTSSAIGLAFAPISTPFTGGSLTARPTSTQEFMWGTTTTGATVVATFLADVVTGNNNYTHYVTADDGQFWFLTSRSGLGIFTTVAGFAKPTGSSDPRAAFVIGSTSLSGRGAMGRSVIFDSGNGAVSRAPNGVATATGGLQVPGYAGGSHYLAVNGVDANTGKYLAFPVDAFSAAVGQAAYRGRFVDLVAVGTRPVGDSFPSTAAQERVVVGDTMLPFPTVVPIV